MTHSVVVADDHAIFRRGLIDILRDAGDYRIMAESADGLEALDACKQHTPDLLVLDLNMPNLDGFGVLRELALDTPTPRVAMLTIYNDEMYLARATMLGAHGYVLKENAEEELLTCLRTIAAGGIFTTPKLLAESGAQFLVQGLESLSEAESKVLRMLAERATSAAIADELRLSRRTVENHRARIVEKLGLHGANALLRFALEYRALIGS